MRNNSDGDCNAVDGGRIERTEDPASGGNAGQPVGVAVAEGGSRAAVSTEAELRAALGDSTVETVVVKAGARIELSSAKVYIKRSVRIEGEGGSGVGGGVVLPTIVGAEGQVVLWLGGTSAGMRCELEGVRIEGRGDRSDGTIISRSGWSGTVAAARCEMVGNEIRIGGESRIELRDCTIVDSKGKGLFVYGGASLSMEGGAVRGSQQAGVSLRDSDTRAEVRLPLRRTQHHSCSAAPCLFRLLAMMVMIVRSAEAAQFTRPTDVVCLCLVVAGRAAEGCGGRREWMGRSSS